MTKLRYVLLASLVLVSLLAIGMLFSASAEVAPVLDPIGDKAVADGELLAFTISAFDPDGDLLIYSTGNLPSGASLNATTQVFSGTPGYDLTGSDPNVHFHVSDGSLTDSGDVSIAVLPLTVEKVRLNMKSYGNHDEMSYSNTLGWVPYDERILNIRPEYVIDNPPHGLYGEMDEQQYHEGYIYPYLLQDVAGYQTAGIRVIGYITSGYEGRGGDDGYNPYWYSLELNKQLIRNMAEIDGVDGVFIDEVSENPDTDSRNYLRELSDLAHSYGLIVWMNTGVDQFSDWYFTSGVADFMQSSEDWQGQNLSQVQQDFGSQISVTGFRYSYTAQDAYELTIDAWKKGLAYSYINDVEYTSIAPWFEEYIALLREYQAGGAPVLDPIGDKAVAEGELLEFTISATDPDEDPLIYSAANLPSGASFNAATQVFSWTPGYDQAGTYSAVHFEVTDGKNTDSEDIAITVTNINQSPQADAGSDQAVGPAPVTVTLDGSGSNDPDGDLLTYLWTQTGGPTVALSDATAVNPIFTATQAGNYVFSLVVNDGEFDSEADSATITATPTPTPTPTPPPTPTPTPTPTPPPLDAEFSAGPLEGLAGVTEFTFTDETTGGTAPYAYEWDFDNDGTVDSTAATPAHVYANAGTYTVTLTVTDSLSTGNAETKTGYIMVYAPGDANKDGSVNSFDITKVKRIIMMLDAETPGADANIDGSVNALDITRIEQLIMGG